MAELKTKPTEQSVEGFLDKVANEKMRDDSLALIKLMKKVTGAAPKMWGPSIIGFDEYHYKYESGREGTMCLMGFSPRKPSMVLYGLGGFPGRESLLKKLGTHKTGKGCLYIKKMDDIDTGVLEKMIQKSFIFLKKKYPK